MAALSNEDVHKQILEDLIEEGFQLKKMEFGDIWAVIEMGLSKIYDIERHLTCLDYMRFYTIVYNYCLKVSSNLIETTSNAVEVASPSTLSNVDTAGPLLNDAPLMPNQGAITLQFRRTFNNINEAVNIGIMYDKVDEFLNEYTKRIFTKIRTNADDSENVCTFSNEWTSFKLATSTINGIFDYMNRLVTLQKQKGIFDERYHTVNLLAMIHWRDNVLLKISDRILPSIFKCIHDDRIGEIVDRNMLRNIIGCYIDLSFNEKLPIYPRSPYNAQSENSVRSMSQSSSFFTSIGTNNSYSNNRIISDDWEQSVYRKHFEIRFLNDTQLFYKKESKIILLSNGFTDYIDYVKRRLKEESDRVQLSKDNLSSMDNLDGDFDSVIGYIHESSAIPLKSICMSALIEDHIHSIKEETKLILKNDNYQALKSVYEVLKSSPHCIEEFKQLISDHIEKIGREAIFLACNQPAKEDFESFEKDSNLSDSFNSTFLIKNKSNNDNMDEKPCCSQLASENAALSNNKYIIDPNTFVQTVINIYEKYESIIKNFLSNDTKFINALQIGCVNFMKNNAVSQSPDKCKPIKMIANYFNSLLRKANIYQNDSDYEDKIQKAFIVFLLIEDKDLFQKYFTENLATRLLSNQTGNLDTEKLVINKFKEICGIEFTSQMQRMLRDMDTSAEMNTQFRTRMNEVGLTATMNKFCLQILSFGSWPLEKEYDCILPSEFKEVVDQVEKFYFSKFNGRKLVWLYLTSRVTLTTNGFSESYIFKTNILQAIVLMHFNDNNTITFHQLSKSTGIQDDILAHILDNLCTCNILLCKNSEDLVSCGATFELNDTFYSRKRIINLYAKYIRIEEPKEDPKPKHVENERRYILEAAIVRIMKARLRMSHCDLVEEVMKQLSTRFKPQMKIIKSCIESLLDKEYLAREEGDASVYIYLA